MKFLEREKQFAPKAMAGFANFNVEVVR